MASKPDFLDCPDCSATDRPHSPPPALPSAKASPQDELSALAHEGMPWAQAELGRQLLYGRGRPANQPCGLCWLAKGAHAGDLDAMLALSQWFLTRTPAFNLALSHFWLTKALSTGSPLALERAGDAVLALNLGPEAVQKAARFYKAGSASCPNCLAKLLDLRLQGRLDKLSNRDRKACMARLEHLAKAGSLHALRAMGEICQARGPRHAKASKDWFLAGAERGERICQRKLALLTAGMKTGKNAMAVPWHWMELAAQEDPEAQYQAGVWLAAGRGCKADPKRAEHFLRLASATLPKALTRLGILLAGDADPARRAEGTLALARAASLGHAEACFELGNMALAERNFEEAEKRFLQAGQHAPSLRRLAEMALDAPSDGEAGGARLNRDGAWHIMLQAASLDDAEAMLRLARHKLSLTEQDRGEAEEALIKEACRLLKDACRQKHPQALHELALLAAQGAPGAPGPDQAMKLHAKAASLGHAESMAVLGMDLLEQAREAAKGREGPATKGHGLVRGSKAGKLLGRAAELGSATSALHYGILLEEGIFVAQDWQLALPCFRKAAQGGAIEGYYRLGLLLLKMGEACEAEGWGELAKAARLGHADAGTMLARHCLACGDRSLAEGWLEKHLHGLADQEDPEGMRLLSEAIERGWAAPSRAGEGHALLVKAADKGDVEALIKLGDKHAKGIGIDQNRDRARQCYAKAAMLGSKEAREKLNSLPRPGDAEPWMTGEKGPGRRRKPG